MTCKRILLMSAMVASAAHAESYVLDAENALAIDSDGLIQTWSASCAGVDAATDAVIATAGKDLRFFAAPEEPLEVGVDVDTFDVSAVAGGQYHYRLVPGARVMARLTVRCGTDDVFDEDIVDSAPVVTAPELLGPDRIIDADTLQELPDGALPSGAAVELVGMSIGAAPRGGEVVTLTIRGAGIDTALELSAGDFVEGHAVISPRLEPTAAGDLVLIASLLGVASSPVTLVVGPAVGGPPDDGTPAALAGGCTASAGGGAWVALVAMLGRRRRRRHRG